uniref:Uncharacterized protein n=1 Tax=Moniliophthora roreri TaxID=221103 RepID=A0A0W0FEG4_MONRR
MPTGRVQQHCIYNPLPESLSPIIHSICYSSSTSLVYSGYTVLRGPRTRLLHSPRSSPPSKLRKVARQAMMIPQIGTHIPLDRSIYDITPVIPQFGLRNPQNSPFHQSREKREPPSAGVGASLRACDIRQYFGYASRWTEIAEPEEGPVAPGWGHVQVQPYAVDKNE